MDLADAVNVFGARFLAVVIEGAPFLLFGALASGLIAVLLERDDLRRVVPRRTALGLIGGGLLGLVLPVGECGALPVARRLLHKGVPAPAAIAFLLAAPVVNPIVLASTYAALRHLAPEFVLLRAGIALIAALVVGALFALHPDSTTLLRMHALEPPDAQSGLRRVLRLAAVEFVSLGRYLLLGALLAGALNVVVTLGDLEAWATSPARSVLALEAWAFIRAGCSAADAYTARELAGSFPLGPVLGFLALGPLLDARGVVMLLAVFRRRIALALIGLPGLIATLVALALALNVSF